MKVRNFEIRATEACHQEGVSLFLGKVRVELTSTQARELAKELNDAANASDKMSRELNASCGTGREVEDGRFYVVWASKDGQCKPVHVTEDKVEALHHCGGIVNVDSKGVDAIQ
jgi:hypothetical protein